MIERIVSDTAFSPRAVWVVSVAAICPECRGGMYVAENEKSLKCKSCEYSASLEKSVDDVADDVLKHVTGNKHMNEGKIRDLAELETRLLKEQDEQQGAD